MVGVGAMMVVKHPTPGKHLHTGTTKEHTLMVHGSPLNECPSYLHLHQAKGVTN